MPTDTSTVELQPGVDSELHTQDLHQQAVSNLNKAFGVDMKPSQLAPASSQVPSVAGNIPENPKTEFVPEEFIKTNTNQSPVMTEPSKGFLGIKLGFLRKKNPGSQIEPEKK